MSHKHFHLVTLGRTALLTPAGEDADLGKRRRKLALLAVIVLSRRPPTREALAEMFWGDEDEERARHSLSDALSHLRRVLGRDTIAARRETVEVDAAGRLAVDAVELEGAHDARDWERVVALYGGDLLADVHVDGSDSFEGWRARERERYRRMFGAACEALTARWLREGRTDEARTLALRWLEALPRSAEALGVVLRAGAAGATPEGRRAALDAYEAHAALLAREHSARVDARLEEQAAALRARVAQDALVVAPVVVTPGAAPSPVADAAPRVATEAPAPAPPRATPPAAPRRWRRPAIALLAAGVIVAALALALRGRGAASAAEPTGAPVVAITEIRVAPGDSEVAWLADGLREMIAADLARARSLGVVPAPRLRDVVTRAAWPAPLGGERELELARRVHATWSLSGAVSRTEGGYVVDLALRDAESGADVKRWTVSGPNVLAVADQAAAVVLGAAGDRTPGVRISEVETSDTDAFREYVRGEQALFAGDEATAARRFDAAIAEDSAFMSAIIARLHLGATFRDSARYTHLRRLFEQAGSRMTEWDRLEDGEYLAFHNGEHARAESLARELVARYPHDPRAYRLLGEVLEAHGQAAAAESARARLLALDSLAIGAGDGPCAACVAYYGLGAIRWLRGDLAGAERMARGWVASQPGSSDAWALLAIALSYAGRHGEATVALHRARMLAPTSLMLAVREARQALVAHRFAEMDSLAARLPTDRDGREERMDLAVMSLLERGRPRAALRVVDSARAAGGAPQVMEMVGAHAAGLLGDARATRWFERNTAHDARLVAASRERADAARAFSWHHALEADALGARADTLWLRAMADSIERIGAASYYARDWRLPHHLRGLIAMRAGRWAEASRELDQARYGVAGWTRTNLLLGQSELAQGHAARAAQVLREALGAPLDAMGRYAPRTEIAFWLARAYAQAGQPDSARTYSAMVREAWRGGEAEAVARLDSLPSR